MLTDYLASLRESSLEKEAFQRSKLFRGVLSHVFSKSLMYQYENRLAWACFATVYEPFQFCSRPGPWNRQCGREVSKNLLM